MKISAFTVGVAGVFSLFLGLSGVLAKEQVDIHGGDKMNVFTAEEQEAMEDKVRDGRNLKVVITAEEQNIVENSLASTGFVPQENGPGFYFSKKK
ncbi:hypothetical protein GJU40_16410 [Bacillus lacus]|uniref:Uncharacterized protein n=1 Tax=Metabacillus lacus TaxID=1983721 RepID=A0A7X2J1P5_9BACI|nr:hypothetical protein [Metabacillus lacus]MRX73725.1 hypothetical protein [Metabacillus lacus]